MAKLKSKSMKHNGIGDTFINFLLVFIPLVAIMGFLLFTQRGVLVNNNIFEITDISKQFVGYKIVHISDIDNSSREIANKVSKLKPDIILVTGGYADKNGNTENTVNTVNKLANIAPTYYIYQPDDNTGCLSGTSATNLNSDCITIEPKNVDVRDYIQRVYGDSILKKADNGSEASLKYIEYIDEQLKETAGQQLEIIGLGSDAKIDTQTNANDYILNLVKNKNAKYRMALLGDIKYADNLGQAPINIMFTGGTHGVKQENNKYDKGVFTVGTVTMLVSNGLEKSENEKNILSIFNIPEITCITLSDGSIKDSNPLEDLMDKVLGDPGTIFDNDGGFEEYLYKYGISNVDEFLIENN